MPFRFVSTFVQLVSTFIAFLKSLFGPPPPPGPPHKIAYDPAHFTTGPNLVTNNSFELGPFGTGTDVPVSGSGVIDNWLGLPVTTFSAVRWIDATHAVFRNAAEGARFVDLTGGRAPGPSRVFGKVFTDSGFAILQGGQSYEVAFDLGVGPNNGAGANFGPPVSATVSVFRPPLDLEETFTSNPVSPPVGTGVVWERFSFRFKVPAGFKLTTSAISISGRKGHQFCGVDNVSLRLLT